MTNGTSSETRRSGPLLATILALSLGLGLWANQWGAPAQWHGDEMSTHARKLVEGRTLDPHHYSYGLLNYYVIALLVVVPDFVYDRVFDPRPRGAGALADSVWARRDQTRIMRGSRAVSAVQAMLLVAVTCWLGAMAFGVEAGLLAAALLAVDPELVTIGHFATVDTGATLWYWAACALSFRYLTGGRRRWFLVAAFASGIAIGLKADRMAIVAPLLGSFVLARPRGRARDLLMPALLLPLGFAVANPLLVTAPFQYVDGFVRDLWYNALRAPQMAFAGPLSYLRAGLGWPLVGLIVVGGGYGLARLWGKRSWATVIWIALTFLPYGFLLGKTDKAWYVPMLFPPLLLLAGFGSTEWLREQPRKVAVIGIGVIALVFAWSLYDSALVLKEFANDARITAGLWITDNVPAGSSILMAGYGPALPLGRYQVREPVRMDLCADAAGPMLRLDNTPAYRRFRRSLLSLERWSGAHLGTPVRRQPYRAWFDVFTAKCEAPASGEPDPDYVVIIGEGETKEVSQEQLVAHFKLVSHFEYPYGGLPGPPLGFVNLPVSVYQREPQRVLQH
jgi:dolichyl-phosphate-mannose-protein mannosyltransferase